MIMEFKHEILNCSERFSETCRTKPFTIIVYTFNYSNAEDKALVDKLLIEASRLAEKVFPGAANDSTHARTRKRIFANCIAGVVSEYCWKHFLNYRREVVRSTPFESASNQIDLEVIANLKKIEVRSSFPRNGVAFAVCHPLKEFDVLGPYSNDYKPGEVHKDYFIRTLFPMKDPVEIIDLIKSNSFSLFLTGGATYDMMFDNRYSKEKDFVPEDNFTIQTKTKYRVVPFHNALDSGEIYRLIQHENEE